MQYSMFDSPLQVCGIPDFARSREIRRLPPELCDAASIDRHLGRRVPGARVRFRTDAETLSVTLKMATFAHDAGMSRYACSSANVCFGSGETYRFGGLVDPCDDLIRTQEFVKGPGLEDVTILFPRNEAVVDVVIEVADDAQVLPPTPYRYERPILFFGSSITEGGHAAVASNAYTALVSRWLDSDYLNFGFSGSCRGQTVLGEYFLSLDSSVFVLDYDHNAPDAAFLRETHEPFYRYLRANRPDLPILMLSAPNYDYLSEAEERRQIIEQTYKNAVAAGDQNVWFVDGRTLFGAIDRQSCTTDTIHPNDLGFYRMATVIYPVLKSILERN
ncbi:MAG: hypothetical protein IJC93_05070 [Clostridia bacterium]|nr:hypothetical protein [Clostridia bacterium]